MPELLRPHLLGLARSEAADRAAVRSALARLARKQVQRICELARVPCVCAHSMRGLHGTLAIKPERFYAHVVAASLGHESPTVTLRSYVAPGTEQRANARRVSSLLKTDPSNWFQSGRPEPWHRSAPAACTSAARSDTINQNSICWENQPRGRYVQVRRMLFALGIACATGLWCPSGAAALHPIQLVFPPNDCNRATDYCEPWKAATPWV